LHTPAVAEALEGRVLLSAAAAGHPLFTTIGSATFDIGAAGRAVIKASGSPVASIRETGALPSGLVWTSKGNGRATITGQPADGSEGVYVLSLVASNGDKPNARQNFTLSVDQAPAITSNSSATFTTGTAGSFTVTTAGFPNSAITERGILPPGIAFQNNGDGTAMLSIGAEAVAYGTYALKLTAKNGAAPNAHQTFTLSVGHPPQFQSAGAVTFIAGNPGLFAVTTSAGLPLNPRLTETGPLPAGIRFQDNGNGTATISGTPALSAGGNYILNLAANNGIGPVATQAFTLSIEQAPLLAGSAIAEFSAGVAGSFTINADTGTSSVAVLTESGALPSGLTFQDNGNNTATISGTPTASAAGIYVLNLTATNEIGPSVTQTITVYVDGPPAITSGAAATFIAGTLGSYAVATSGFPNGVITESGALPGGITFVDNRNGTATISGMATASADGVYPLNITVNNGIAPAATQAFTLTIGQTPSITSTGAAPFTAGVPGSFTITTTGFPVGVISESGTLPGGMTFQDNGNGTAIIVGIPDPGVSGISYPLTIAVNNGIGPAVTQAFRLIVNQSLAITSPAAATFTVGVAETFTMTTSNTQSTLPALAEIGNLPNGISFVDNDDGTATISGTPATSTGGIYGLYLTATYFGAATNAAQLLVLTVDQPPAFFSSATATFAVVTAGSFTVSTNDPAPSSTFGADGSFAINTSGGVPSATVLSEAGKLPSGLLFKDNGDGTATISGTPAASAGGAYVLNITASNGIAPDTAQSLTLYVDGPPSITSSPTATFTTGSLGSFTVTTSGLPYGVIAEIGALPAGITFADNHDGTATFAGAAAASADGAYILNLSVSNGFAPAATQTLTLTVDQPPAITSGDAINFDANASSSFTITTTGFPNAAITESGQLPAGVTFADNGNGTATIAANLPESTVGGTYPLIITANNGVEPDAVLGFTLTVTQVLTITSSATAAFASGAAGSFTIATTSLLPITPVLTEVGALPPGVTFVDNADGTATISGTPAPGTGGVYGVSITAANGTTPVATQLFELSVDQAPSFVSSPAATFTAGVTNSFTVSTITGVPFPKFGADGSFTLTTTGGFPLDSALTEVGALPAGVSFLDNGNGTATISGTPELSSVGTYILFLTADNGVAPNATQTFTLTVM
jgi:hypothetical protein